MIKRELYLGYELEADSGKELVLISGETELARAKQVFIPTGETLNKWVELEEMIKQMEPISQPTIEDKIEELELELERLKQQLK